MPVVYLLLALLTIFYPAAARSDMTHLRVTDDFNRADGGLGAEYTAIPTIEAPVIETNRAVDTTIATTSWSGAYRSAETFEVDQYVEAEMVLAAAATITATSAVLRQSATNYSNILLQKYNGNLALHHVVAGVVATTWPLDSAWYDYNHFLVEARGLSPDISFHVYGKTALAAGWTYLTVVSGATAEDSGKPGFRVLENTPTSGKTYVDNFACGNINNRPCGGSLVAADGGVILHPGTTPGASGYKYYLIAATAQDPVPSKSNYAQTGTATDSQPISGLTNGTQYNIVYTAIVDSVESSESAMFAATPTAAALVDGYVGSKTEAIGYWTTVRSNTDGSQYSASSETAMLLAGNHFWDGESDPTWIERYFLSLDLTSYSSEKEVEEFILKPTVTSTGTGNARIAVQEANALSAIGPSTYSNFPGAPNGTILGYSEVCSATGQKHIAFNAYGKAYIKSKLGGIAYLVLREYAHDALGVDPGDGNYKEVVIATRSHSTPGSRPTFAITLIDALPAPVNGSAQGKLGKVIIDPGVCNDENLDHIDAYYTTDGSTPTSGNGTLLEKVYKKQEVKWFGSNITFKIVFYAKTASGLSSPASAVYTATTVDYSTELKSEIDAYGRLVLGVPFTPTTLQKSDGASQTVDITPAHVGNNIYVDKHPQTNYKHVALGLSQHVGPETFQLSGCDFLFYTRVYGDYHTLSGVRRSPTSWTVNGNDYPGERFEANEIWIGDFDGYWDEQCWGTGAHMGANYPLANQQHTFSIPDGWVTGYDYSDFRVEYGAAITYSFSDGVNSANTTLNPKPNKTGVVRTNIERYMRTYENYPTKHTGFAAGYDTGRDYINLAWAYWATHHPQAAQRCRDVFDARNMLESAIDPSYTSKEIQMWRIYGLYTAYRVFKEKDPTYALKYLEWAARYTHGILTGSLVLTGSRNGNVLSNYPRNQVLGMIYGMALVYNEPAVANITSASIDGADYSYLYQDTATNGLHDVILATFNSQMTGYIGPNGEPRYGGADQPLLPDEGYGHFAYTFTRYLDDYFGDNAFAAAITKSAQYMTRRGLLDPFFIFSCRYQYQWLMSHQISMYSDLHGDSSELQQFVYWLHSTMYYYHGNAVEETGVFTGLDWVYSVWPEGYLDFEPIDTVSGGHAIQYCEHHVFMLEQVPVTLFSVAVLTLSNLTVTGCLLEFQSPAVVGAATAEVWRHTTPPTEDGALIAEGLTGDAHTDATGTPNTLYWYTVVYRDADGFEVSRTEDEYITTSKPPLAATEIDDIGCVLTFLAPSYFDATFYFELHRGSSPGFTPGVGSLLSTETPGTGSFHDESVPNPGDLVYYIGIYFEAGGVEFARTAELAVQVLTDSTPAVVETFTVGSPTELTVPITAFTASDNLGVTGFLITESSAKPAAGAAGWTALAPASYQTSSYGTKTLYPWAKDEAGNVSAVFGSPRQVTFVDVTRPVVGTFTVGLSTGLQVPITAFVATDFGGVTGYLITESNTPPLASAGGWSGTIPDYYISATYGTKYLYPWAKDAAGNVSLVFANPPGVTFASPGDVTPPTVETFTVGSPTELTVPVTAFTGADDIGVTGYLITESATQPGPGAAGWTAEKPTTYTTASAGSKTLYPWVRDAAGNVSAVFASPRTVAFASSDATKPLITAFTLPAESSSLLVNILSYEASDNVGVTGYLVKESSAPPLAGASGWTSSKPTSYLFASAGAKVLYAFAKDAAGNVSDAVSAQVTITVSSVPTLLSPIQGAVAAQPTEFSWTAVGLAVCYQIQIATDSGFLNIVLDQTTAENSISVFGFAESISYYWRVRAGF